MEMIIIEKAVLDELTRRMEVLSKKVKQLYVLAGCTGRHIWLDSQEVCQLYGISVRSLAGFRERGALPFTQIGAKIFYKSADMDAFFRSKFVPGDLAKEKSKL